MSATIIQFPSDRKARTPKPDLVDELMGDMCKWITEDRARKRSARKSAAVFIDMDPRFHAWIVAQNHQAREIGRPYKRYAQLKREYIARCDAETHA